MHRVAPLVEAQPQREEIRAAARETALAYCVPPVQSEGLRHGQRTFPRRQMSAASEGEKGGRQSSDAS